MRSPSKRASSIVLSYLQVTCFVQPPVTAEAAVDAAAASAIAVYVEKLQPDVPDSFARARHLSIVDNLSRSSPKTSLRADRRPLRGTVGTHCEEQTRNGYMFNLINNQDQSKQASFLLIMKMNQARKVPSNICICLISFNLTAKVFYENYAENYAV